MTTVKSVTKDICYIGIGAALITVCAWLSIPAVVSFTLQTFAVSLIAALFGIKNSSLSVIVYIFLGAVGVPVFSGFRGGMGALLGVTGGYIVGFLVMALAESLIIHFFGRKIPVMAIAMVVGLILCYAFGTAWFMFVYLRNTGSIGLLSVLTKCVFPFIIPDLLKLSLALFIAKRLEKPLKLR